VLDDTPPEMFGDYRRVVDMSVYIADLFGGATGWIVQINSQAFLSQSTL
jgi:hypothetical protein